MPGTGDAAVRTLDPQWGSTAERLARPAGCPAAQQAAWIERCQAIPGVGPLTAMARVASWQRVRFRSADAFIAFLALDVRVKQSGRWQGRCKLTKKGDGEVRRLLYNAAMQGRRSPQWAPH